MFPLSVCSAPPPPQRAPAQNGDFREEWAKNPLALEKTFVASKREAAQWCDVGVLPASNLGVVLSLFLKPLKVQGVFCTFLHFFFSLRFCVFFKTTCFLGFLMEYIV